MIVLKIIVTIVVVNWSIKFLGSRLAKTESFKRHMERKYGLDRE